MSWMLTWVLENGDELGLILKQRGRILKFKDSIGYKSIAVSAPIAWKLRESHHGMDNAWTCYGEEVSAHRGSTFHPSRVTNA